MITAYLRVSTDKQDVDNQRFHINEYCKENKITVDEWIEETITGRKKFRNRKIWPVIENLSKEDTIIVSEMSRIGRDMFDSIRLLIECMDVGATFISVDDNYILSDDLMVKFWGITKCFKAEMEVADLRNRVKRALKRKKSEGVILGRPEGTKASSYKLDPHADTIKELLGNGTTKTEIACRFSTTRRTLDKFINERL